MSSREMFAYDSIPVLSAWSGHQYLCVTHREKELIPPCLGLCTVPTISVGSSIIGLVFVSRSFLVWCVWLSSVARSCATRDGSNKDNLWKPTIPAGINRLPPSETISHVTGVLDHQTGYTTEKISYPEHDPVNTRNRYSYDTFTCGMVAVG